MAGKTTKKTAPISTKVEAVRRFFADSKAANHPIKEHPVSTQEEYVRDLYLEMLCVVAQYENGNTENAFTLVKRIMAACENTQDLQEYIKCSLEITPERTAEFIKQCKGNGLCEIFMVDSMLLSCSNGEPNAKQVAFLTEFGDMLGFDREKLKELAQFACKSLEWDDKHFNYTRAFTDGKIMETKTDVHYYNATGRAFLKLGDTLEIANKDTVIFDNMVFDGVSVVLKSIKKVIFQNCVFKHKEFDESLNSILYCEVVSQVELSRCKFVDITSYFIIYNEKSKITIISSSFVDCDCDGIFGPVGFNEEKTYLDDCEFKSLEVDCFGSGDALYITNSVFINCKSRQNYLFVGKLKKDQNNRFENCSKCY